MTHNISNTRFDNNSEPGWIPIKRYNPANSNNFGGLSLENLRAEGGNRVRIEKLDDILDIPSLSLLKADVEGMEADVLRGAAGLIREHRPILYVEAHHPEDAPSVIREALALDYDLYWHLPLMFNKDNFAGDSENIFENVRSRNILCTPSERKINVGKARPVAGENDHPSMWR